MDGGSFVELKKVRIVVVSLPTERGQLAFEHGVRTDDLVSWSVDEHLTRPGVGALQGIRPVHQPDDAIIENPNPRHVW
ncbi:hypothetical protein TB2_021513 [Malus domestica]